MTVGLILIVFLAIALSAAIGLFCFIGLEEQRRRADESRPRRIARQPSTDADQQQDRDSK